MEGKIPGNIDNEYYQGLIGAWSAGNASLPTDGGESPEQVVARQKPAIDVILSHPDENPVLVAMHGRGHADFYCAGSPISRCRRWTISSTVTSVSTLFSTDYATQTFQHRTGQRYGAFALAGPGWIGVFMNNG